MQPFHAIYGCALLHVEHGHLKNVIDFSTSENLFSITMFIREKSDWVKIASSNTTFQRQ